MIVVEASKTRRHLRELCVDLDERIKADNLPEGVYADSQYLADCLDRFNIWAGSLGVFQRGDASLDSRLSNHSLVREVLRLLKQVDIFTSALKTIIDGSQTQKIWTRASLHISRDEFAGSDDFSDDDKSDVILTPETIEDRGDPNELITESKDLHLSVNESITSLLRLSIQVHTSSRKAKFARSSVDQDYSIVPDTTHVRDFFPFAAGNEPLVTRLGKANAQRRQWLWYRQRHREKLAVDVSGPREEHISAFGATELADTESFAMFSAYDQPSGSILSGTKATTFRSRLAATALLQSDMPDTVFGRSSRAIASEQKLLVPKPPQNLVLGQPYLCRYCCNVIEVSGKNTWQKHVHADLSSYTCVFENCDEMFFESRQKWWAHEIEAHRKKWDCSVCGSQRPSFAAMKEHLHVEHPDKVPVDQLEDVAFKFGRPLGHFNAADCPLCDYAGVLRRRGHSGGEIAQIPADKFSWHLGRHLEQLALFVLPNTDLMGEEDGISDDGGFDPLDSEAEGSEAGAQPLSELDLIQRLSEAVAEEKASPEILSKPPDLAMRWQPPQDFTPPREDFDTHDVDLLPVRQEPIYGGDLHTPGWARGLGNHKEGFCARCPVFHWVNITDGSYRFHLTYFHGVPDSGFPLPRPSTIRPAERKANTWEGFCEACDKWMILKKTKRGWNWYRHWLVDHAEIIRDQTEAIRNGISPEVVQIRKSAESPQEARAPAGDQTSLAQSLQVNGGLLRDDAFITSQIVVLLRNDMPEALEGLLMHLSVARSRDEIRTIVDMTAEGGETPLMIAASQGLDSVVDLLLDFGADPNATGPGDQTALDLATDAGYFTTAQKLVSRGTDASKSHVFKRIFSNEREYAGEMTQTVHLIASSSKINLATLTPLGRAAFYGDTDAARKLLGSDDTGPSRCDSEEGAESGCSPFSLASMQGHFEVMDLLLARGANINATSKHGWTPLMLATNRADEECVSYLLSKGADVNHLSPDRWTALAESASRGFTRIMAQLLDFGADPEIRAQSDWTPLMHAAYRGDIEAVHLLLSVGASFEEISARDETVMLLAAAQGSAEVVRRLLEAGCAPDSIWSKAPDVEPGSSREEREESSLEPGQSPPAKPQQRIERVYKVGWTPLMVSCQIGSLEVVTMLLDAGANPVPKSPMFKTALEIARENGRTDVVEYLMRRLG